MMTTIKYNLTFSMTLNFIAILLAITDILSPVVGALAPLFLSGQFFPFNTASPNR